MQLMTQEIETRLKENAQNPDGDHVPVVKFFNPAGAATWLITELDPEDGDTMFGLADLGFGCPELGSVSLRELQEIQILPGLGIERDLHWTGEHPISVYAAVAAANDHIVDRPSDAQIAAARR